MTTKVVLELPEEDLTEELDPLYPDAEEEILSTCTAKVGFGDTSNFDSVYELYIVPPEEEVTEKSQESE